MIGSPIFDKNVHFHVCEEIRNLSSWDKGDFRNLIFVILILESYFLNLARPNSLLESYLISEYFFLALRQDFPQVRVILKTIQLIQGHLR